MPDPEYTSPTIDRAAFNCPHCSAYAHQLWYAGAVSIMEKRKPSYFSEKEIAALVNSQKQVLAQDKLEMWEKNIGARKPVVGTAVAQLNHLPLHNVWFSQCAHCENFAIWRHNRIVWPQTGNAPPPNSDLPADIGADYEEASAILRSSPRGAAALLRLAVEKLCKHLGESGDKLNDNIASLVKKGLDADVQKAFDTVRIIGNNSVHPGQIDFQNDEKTARSLFDLVNVIVDSMISQKRKIREMYKNLPIDSRQSIEKRDK